jgi:hypothetical protein
MLGEEPGCCAVAAVPKEKGDEAPPNAGALDPPKGEADVANAGCDPKAVVPKGLLAPVPKPGVVCWPKMDVLVDPKAPPDCCVPKPGVVPSPPKGDEEGAAPLPNNGEEAEPNAGAAVDPKALAEPNPAPPENMAISSAMQACPSTTLQLSLVNAVSSHQSKMLVT